MKLLLDQNLSHHLVKRLADLYPGPRHIRLAGLDREDDAVVRDYAKNHGFCIVTQDKDYSELLRLRGAPPKVVWLRYGNTRTSEIERILRENAQTLMELETNSELHVIESFG